jgi:predicted nucleic acid-binding protein
VIVVDTNIIVYSLVEGDMTPHVLKAREKDPYWVVPVLWRHEFLNVLSTLTRKGILEKVQSDDLWLRAVRIFHTREYYPDMLEALHLSIDAGISAYDAQYILLAKSLEIPCLTEDRKLLERFPEAALSSRQFAGT